MYIKYLEKNMIGKWLVRTCGSHGLIWEKDGDAVMTYYEWLGFIWCWCWWWYYDDVENDGSDDENVDDGE